MRRRGCGTRFRRTFEGIGPCEWPIRPDGSSPRGRLPPLATRSAFSVWPFSALPALSGVLHNRCRSCWIIVLRQGGRRDLRTRAAGAALIAGSEASLAVLSPIAAVVVGCLLYGKNADPGKRAVMMRDSRVAPKALAIAIDHQKRCAEQALEQFRREDFHQGALANFSVSTMRR